MNWTCKKSTMLTCGPDMFFHEGVKRHAVIELGIRRTHRVFNWYGLTERVDLGDIHIIHLKSMLLVHQWGLHNIFEKKINIAIWLSAIAKIQNCQNICATRFRVKRDIYTHVVHYTVLALWIAVSCTCVNEHTVPSCWKQQPIYLFARNTLK